MLSLYFLDSSAYASLAFSLLAEIQTPNSKGFSALTSSEVDTSGTAKPPEQVGNGKHQLGVKTLGGTVWLKEVQLQVVKNTLLKRAMESVDGRDYSELFEVLKGNTSVMTAEMGNVPAKLIKEFRKKDDRPLLKGAWVEETVYLGDNQLETLASLKSKNELIGDVIMLLQSPAKNVISALNSGGSTLSGIVKTLSERSE